jgi:hypothetical protein
MDEFDCTDEIQCEEFYDDSTLDDWEDDREDSFPDWSDAEFDETDPHDDYDPSDGNF